MACPKCGFVEEGEIMVDVGRARNAGMITAIDNPALVRKPLTDMLVSASGHESAYLAALTDAAKPFEVRTYYCHPGKEADFYVELRFGCTNWILARKDFVRRVGDERNECLRDAHKWVLTTADTARRAIDAAMESDSKAQ